MIPHGMQSFSVPSGSSFCCAIYARKTHVSVGVLLSSQLAENIARWPLSVLAATLDKRYDTLALEPRKIKFIDRIVADTRDVALNKTAGLALPHQFMMSLFSVAEIMDGAKVY